MKTRTLLTFSSTLFFLLFNAEQASSQQLSLETQAANQIIIDSAKIPPLEEAAKYLPEPISQEVRLVLVLSQRQVHLYKGDTLQASYPVAIGKKGWETPTGEFEITQKVSEPAWENPFTGAIVPPGKNNPLGVRWIGFWTDGRDYIGFHGTPNESLIGQAVSHGCVRMRNRDVIALFEQVELGTPVVVKP